MRGLKFKQTIVLFAINISSRLIYAHTTPENLQNFDYIVDQIYANSESEEITKEELALILDELYTQPLNLNLASTEELEDTHILSTDQITALHRHISEHGPLLSIYELQAVPGFDTRTIRLLRNFVYVDELKADPRNGGFITEGVAEKNNSVSFLYKRRFLSNQESSDWYKRSRRTGRPKHLGSPDEVVTKVRIRHPAGYDIGISAKKSQGEAFVWEHKGRRYGFNVYRAHLMIKDRSVFKRIIFGNYEVGYGQGLVNSAGFSLGQSGEPVKVIKTNNTGIRPYTSPKGIKLCGVATTISSSTWEFTPYYSYVKLDHEIFEKGTRHQHTKSQLSRMCNYDNYTRLKNRNTLTENLFGSTFLHKSSKKDYEIGTNVLYNNLDIPIFPKDHDESDDEDESVKKRVPHNFSGTNNLNISVFYRYLLYNIHLFGEEAISKNFSKKTTQTKRPSPAFINGAVISLHKTLDTTVLHRYYSPSYNCLYGNPFKKSTHAQNEHGLYTGLRYRPVHRWYFDTSFDYVNIPRPDKGQKPHIYDYVGKVTYEPTRTWISAIQYSQKIKDTKVTKKESKDYPYPYSKKTMHKVKIQSSYFITKSLRLKSEIDINRCHKVKSTTWGYAVFQDLMYKEREYKAAVRLGWIDPQSNANKVYSYEPGLLNAGGMGSHAYTKRGIFTCIVLGYKPTPSWRVEVKYSHMHKFEKEANRPKPPKPYSNIDNEISMQICYLF